MMNVSIVILNYNGLKDTIECLKSLFKVNLEKIKLRILVIDNASYDYSAETIRKFSKTGKHSNMLTLEVIENENNLGFAGGNNVGIKEALSGGADYIMLLNNDTVVDKDFLVRLVEIFSKDKKIGIVVPKIYFYPGFEFYKDRYKDKEKGKVIWYAGAKMDWKNLIGSHLGVDEVDNGQYDKIYETEFATGCCMLIKKEVFEKVGFLDEKYFLYYEDSDFAMRAKRKGFKIIFAPSAIVWHKNAGSGGGSGSKLQDYYITRNRLLFGSRYASFRTKLALTRESLKIIFFGRYWQKKAVMDFYSKRLGKGSFKT